MKPRRFGDVEVFSTTNSGKPLPAEARRSKKEMMLLQLVRAGAKEERTALKD